MTSRLRHRLRETALTLGAVLGLCCVALAVANAFFGVHVLVFRSGSMSPTIETGGAALARTVPVAEVGVGDIVSVKNAEGVRVTHRVKTIQQHGKSTALILKGDANHAADESAYQPREVDRVFWHANRLGYVVHALGSPYALVAGGAFAMVLLYLGFSKRVNRSDDDGDSAGDPRRGSVGTDPTQPEARSGRHRAAASGRYLAVVAGALVSVFAMLLPTGLLPTLAAFDDIATVTSGAFSVRTLPPTSPPNPPANFACSHQQKTKITLSWKHLGPGHTYQLQIKAVGSSSVVSTYTQFTPSAPGAGSTVSFDLPTNATPQGDEDVKYKYVAELTAISDGPPPLTSTATTTTFTVEWDDDELDKRRCGS